MLIGGAFAAGEGANETIVDPRTGSAIADIAQASTAQVDAAVSAARAAFGRWSRTTPAERSALLLKVADVVEQDAHSLARLEARNTGKPLHAVLADEIPAIADCFRYFAAAARTMPGMAAGEYLAGYTVVSLLVV